VTEGSEDVGALLIVVVEDSVEVIVISDVVEGTGLVVPEDVELTLV
jgi:hypothetical protein